MALFALQVPDQPKVHEYLAGVREKLSSPSWTSTPFSGSVRRLSDGLYVLEVTPLYPRLVLNTFMLLMLVGSLVLGYLGWGMAFYLYWSIGFGFVVTNLFWTPFFYQALIWWQTHKLLKGWYRVRRAEAMVLRRVVHGEV